MEFFIVTCGEVSQLLDRFFTFILKIKYTHLYEEAGLSRATSLEYLNGPSMFRDWTPLSARHCK